MDDGMICLNCFSELHGAAICPRCKYDKNATRKNAMAIKPLTPVGQGRFLLGRILGAGGFGITYMAYDNKTKKTCAVKEYAPLNVAVRGENQTELLPTSEENRRIYEHGKRRFYEEAEALYKCRQIPEIVQLVGYFQENNTAYFAMEYIEGITLRKFQSKCPDKRVPQDQAIEIMTKACDAVNRVHEVTGIFHRDISPENIMIDVKGNVRVIDFGNAKNLDGGNSKFSVVLKPGFAPPEQYSSTGRQGRYTDVYALAGTMYYILSGQLVPPATERTAGKVYTKLKDLGIGIDSDLSDAIDAGLALKVVDRIATVAEFSKRISKGEVEVTITKPSVINVQGNNATRQLGEPYIQVIQGPMKNNRWKLPKDKDVTLGRSMRSVIVIRDNPMVSKLHATIRYESSSNTFMLKDTDSTNGTYMTDMKLVPYQTYQLKAGDTFELGAGIMKIKVGVEYNG